MLKNKVTTSFASYLTLFHMKIFHKFVWLHVRHQVHRVILHIIEAFQISIFNTFHCTTAAVNDAERRRKLWSVVKVGKRLFSGSVSIITARALFCGTCSISLDLGIDAVRNSYIVIALMKSLAVPPRWHPEMLISHKIH
uniref:Uncharacterized protein n=1 Tax=Rhipicephalus zambeziensis TaxID=60191 RepID=A0A224YCI5_9ACAR